MMSNNSIHVLHTHICTFILCRPYHPSISWKYYIMSTVPGSLRRNIAHEVNPCFCPCYVSVYFHAAVVVSPAPLVSLTTPHRTWVNSSSFQTSTALTSALIEIH